MKSSEVLKAFLFSGIALLASSCALPLAVDSAEAKSEVPQEAPIKLSKKKLRVGDKTVLVEVADTDEKRARGLMYRDKLPENEGMLFIFNREEPLSFWMKNTWIPLAIGYFDRHRKLIEVHEMVPAVLGERETRHYPSTRPAQYALEMPKGWFTRNNVKAGAVFSFVDSQ